MFLGVSVMAEMLKYGLMYNGLESQRAQENLKERMLTKLFTSKYQSQLTKRNLKQS